MDLLAELHQQGATICMVTHDPRYLKQAQRTIYLFDGRLDGHGPVHREVA
jgi:putative ABC transport system ATP-binding protein